MTRAISGSGGNVPQADADLGEVTGEGVVMDDGVGEATAAREGIGDEAEDGVGHFVDVHLPFTHPRNDFVVAVVLNVAGLSHWPAYKHGAPSGCLPNWHRPLMHKDMFIAPPLEAH